jgi:regulator of replication initiation timing
MEVSSKLEGSYATALNIWIDRFKTAQGVIRDLEQENEELRTENERLREALSTGDGSMADGS